MILVGLLMLAADPACTPWCTPTPQEVQWQRPMTTITTTTSATSTKSPVHPSAHTTPTTSTPLTTATTTTTTPAPPTALQAARSLLGSAPSYVPDGYWCWKLVEDVLARAGHPVTADGPNGLQRALQPVSEPVPGDVVFIGGDPVHAPGYVTHVAIVEAVTADGVDVIEGNGSPATANQVGRDHWPTVDILGYGRP